MPYDADESVLYTLTTLERDADELMPPSNAGGPLSKDLTERLRMWIDQGAIWPSEISLKARVRKVDRADSPDNADLVATIHQQIRSTSKEDSEDEMADYAAKVPLTDAAFEMVAIKGGTFRWEARAPRRNERMPRDLKPK